MDATINDLLSPKFISTYLIPLYFLHPFIKLFPWTFHLSYTIISTLLETLHKKREKLSLTNVSFYQQFHLFKVQKGSILDIMICNL